MLAIWFALGSDASLIVGVVTVRVVTVDDSRHDSKGAPVQYTGIFFASETMGKYMLFMGW